MKKNQRELEEAFNAWPQIAVEFLHTSRYRNIRLPILLNDPGEKSIRRRLQELGLVSDHGWPLPDTEWAADIAVRFADRWAARYGHSSFHEMMESLSTSATHPTTPDAPPSPLPE